MTLTVNATDVALHGEQHSGAKRSTPVRPGVVHPGIDLAFARGPLSGAGELSKADAARPAMVRRTIQAALRQWGRADLAESAKLITTELVTNALEHGRGPIRVRMYLNVSHLVIQVRDGSPERPSLRRAGPDDESGRGLLLIRALADEWSVSEDGTSTRCTLALPGSNEVIQPTALHAPILREWETVLPVAPESALRWARMNTRSLLTMWHWSGNVHAATEVVHRLVANALVHGLGAPDRLPFRLAVTESGELLVEVSDPNPGFPGFVDARNGEEGRGLWEVTQLGGLVTWYVRGAGGKTVQARMKAAVPMPSRARSISLERPVPDLRVRQWWRSPAAPADTDRPARHRVSSDPGDGRQSTNATAAL